MSESIMDYTEIDGFDCEGDEVKVEIVMEYDLSDGLYTVDVFRNGRNIENEDFDDRLTAERCFSRFVRETREWFDEERADYVKTVTTSAVDSLKEIVVSLGNDLTVDALLCITLLADMIKNGDSGRASLALVYA